MIIENWDVAIKMKRIMTQKNISTNIKLYSFDNNQMCLNKHKSNYLKTQVVVNTAQTSIWVKMFALSSNSESHVSLAPFWMYHYYPLILNQTGDTTCVGVSIVWVIDWVNDRDGTGHLKAKQFTFSKGKRFMVLILWGCGQVFPIFD